MLPFCLLTAALLQSPAAEPKLASVEGSVRHAGSGVPVRKAKVTLQSTGVEQSSSVESGDDGKFVFDNVKPGRYRIRAEKTGYETAGYGAKRTGDANGQVIAIGAAAPLTGIDIALPKQGAIAGKIYDNSGEPVNAALVMALASMYYQSGRRARIPRGAVPVLSNDLGEYRVGQLPPGKYILCAIPKSSYQPAPPDKEFKSQVSQGEVTTCFPGVENMSEATEIEIRDGSEIPSTDIRLAKVKTVTVSGHLANVPASAGTITVLNLNTKTAGPMGNAIHPRAMVQSADGRFEFRNVPPGSYILHTLPTGLGNAPFLVKHELIVGERPLENLEIPISVPFEIKGKVQAEPGPELKLGSVRVILTGADDITPAVGMATATSEGELTLANVVPGRYRLSLTGVPPTHYVREIRAGDQVAPGDEIDIAGPGTVLTVSLALGKSEVAGSVKNEKGEASPGATVALIPNPMRAFRIRLSRTDQNGVFRMPGTPPGDYRAIAFDSIDAAGLENEEFVKPFASKWKRIKVDDGGSQSLDLTVVAGPKN